MENASDYLMLRLLLICMRWNKKVCYKVSDNTICYFDCQYVSQIYEANELYYSLSFFLPLY